MLPPQNREVAQVYAKQHNKPVMMKPPSKSLPPKVLFFGSLYAGHRTRFLNLQAHTKHDPRIAPEYRSVSGWVEGGLV
jgi:hypothetical protein